MPYTLEAAAAGIKAAKEEINEKKLSTTPMLYFYNGINRGVPTDEGLAALFPGDLTQGSIFVPQDQQEERRKLSNDAWTNMIIEVGQRNSVYRPDGACPQIDALFRRVMNSQTDDVKAANQAYNEKLRQAVVSQDLSLQAEIYEDHLAGLDAYDVDKLEGAADKEFVEQFPQFYEYYNTAKHAAQLLHPDNANDLIHYMSDEGKEKLQGLVDKLPQLSVLMARYEMICNPCYEKLDFSKLRSEKDAMERFSKIAAAQAKASEAAAPRAKSAKAAADQAKAASDSAAKKAKAAQKDAEAKAAAASEAADALKNLGADASAEEKAAAKAAADEAKAAGEEAAAKAKAAQEDAETKAKAASDKEKAANEAAALQANPGNLAALLNQFSNLVYQQADLKFSRELKERNVDLNSLRIVELPGTEYSLHSTSDLRCEKAVQEGKNLLFLDGNGNSLILRQKKEGGMEFAPVGSAHLVDNAILQSLETGVDELVNLATGSVADPLWLMSGSAEYRDLKTALLDFDKLRKVIGHPPRVELLGKLNDTLDHMEGAALNYLKHKDPAITDSTTFESYKAAKGANLNMSPRELARLQSAFFTRDRARTVRSAVSLGQELGSKYDKTKQVLTANADNKVFYQGLLRKYNGLQKEMDKMMDTAMTSGDEEAFAHINNLLTDPKMFDSSRNPYPRDPKATLLWELRQTMQIIEDTEKALGLYAQERKIDPQETARIQNTKNFKERDPANLSVLELRAYLDRSARAAEAEQAAKAEAEQKRAERNNQKKKAPRKPDYSPTEFVMDKMILDSEIAYSNSSQEVKSFLSKNRSVLKSKSQKLLTHRSKALERIEELEENNPSHHPTESYTIYENGQKVEGRAPTMGDKIMLEGVHERRSQTTMNGCWSVSFCSQLEYRGIELSQEEIRAYRPNEKNWPDGNEGDQYYRNEKQTIYSYAGLAARVLPNSTMCMATFYAGSAGSKQFEERKAAFKNSIFYALTKDNSPVSICAGGHYLTIVGMEGDNFFVKDPMHFFGGNPESVIKWSFDDFVKKGRGHMQTIWFTDVEPTLGGGGRGNICEKGTFYANGRAYSNLGEEPEAEQTAIHTEFDRTFPDGSSTSVKIVQPRRMNYKRIPGGSYNADALAKMENALRDFSKDGELFAQEVKDILAEAQKLQKGEYKKNPDEGMLALAEKYRSAYNAVKEAYEKNPTEAMRTLQETLTDHLTKVRSAVIEQREAKYKLLVGPYNFKLIDGKQQDRADYRDLKQGMAGLLYFRYAREKDLGEKDWINMVTAEKKNVDQMRDDDAFKNMVDEIYDDMDKFRFHLDKTYADNYKVYKEYLENQAKQNPMEQIQEKLEGYNAGLTPKEAQERLQALEEERREVLAKAGITDPTKEISSYDRLKTYSANELRGAIRSGNTDALLARYQKHMQMANAKKNAPKNVAKNVLPSVNQRKVVVENKPPEAKSEGKPEVQAAKS